MPATSGARRSPQAKTGRQAVLEQFLADGMRHMFGNPGTVEQGFLDALTDYPDLRYVPTLQETVAVMAADGYARATRKPAVVQIHSTPGLGNAIGALYQAWRGHSPLVVIGGDAGVRYAGMDAQMAGDLVGMARPVTKYATAVLEPHSMLRVLRRAIKIAGTAPMGPVYVCLPMDVLDDIALEEAVPTSIPSTRVVPDAAFIKQAASMLARAERPMIYAGDGVAYSDAQDELTRVAELLGAEVWEADAGEVNISRAHALYQGATGHMFGYQSKPITTRGDVNLICGTYVLPEVFPELGNIFAPGAKTIHIDLNAYEIAKNFPVDLGAVSDPKLTLGLLAQELENAMGASEKGAARTRAEKLGKERQERDEAARKKDESVRDAVPMHMSRFVQELKAQAPEDTVIFDEALTNSPPLVRYFQPKRTGEYFLTRGGSLGVGFPGALGVKLANPERTVIGFSGDGGAMYTIQALWTAARHNTNVKFVVCNNGSYRLLQLNLSAYWQERKLPAREFPLGFDLSKPSLKFDDMARSMGVASTRVEKPWDIAEAVRDMLAHPGPFLIDLALEGDTHPELIGVRCGQ